MHSGDDGAAAAADGVIGEAGERQGARHLGATVTGCEKGIHGRTPSTSSGIR